MAKTQRERDAAARKAKLERIDEQVKDGSLVIRKMSAKERKMFASKADDTPRTPAERKKAEAAHARRARRKERASS